MKGFERKPFSFTKEKAFREKENREEKKDERV